MLQDNILGRRRTLTAFIAEGAMDERVLNEIIPNGMPLDDEDYLWDYKLALPTLPSNPSPEAKTEYAYKMGEIVKDVVSFHNTYGGYLVVGITDDGLEVCGFEEAFDVNDLCKKVFGATRATIDLKYRQLKIGHGRSTKVGLLFIPRRTNASDPVQFLKDAPSNTNNKKGYCANDIYMRSREECRKANTAADYALLFNREKFGVSSLNSDIKYVENNLPARDPQLLDFVGREEQLDQLWGWFVDRYTAVKLLSGSGGVGKTSLAWTFCDAVSKNSPAGLDKVVWLTAKKRTYAALVGDYVDIAHTSFTDLMSLLKALLGELGVPEQEIPEDPSREELIEDCIAAVKSWPCLLVVDDIDSLPSEEQYDVFRTVATIFDRVIASGATRARALLTARLNLGAAPGQLIQISGLPLDDFREYVESVANVINAPLIPGPARKSEIQRLHVASNGSPLFAASILRLMALGDPLSTAIAQFKGAEGEEVRRFAFEREISALPDSQLRVLFAAIHLEECTISQILEAVHSNRTSVRDDIGGLRNYHLMAVNAPDGFLRDDPIISVPSEIRAMADIIRKKIADPRRIETNCAKLNRASASTDMEAAKLFNRVLRYWSEEDYSLAVEAAEYAAKRIPRNPDVWCLLGRAYLNGPNIDAKKADAALRKATELGSTRPELEPLRIKAKEILQDWLGIIHLFEKRDRLDASDTLLLARANQILGDNQASAGSWTNAAPFYLRGATVIRDTFVNQRAHGSVEALKSLKADLCFAYFNAVVNSTPLDDDRIEVWDASELIRRYEVHHRETIARAIAAAVAWTNAVLRRRKMDPQTSARLDRLVVAMSNLAISYTKGGESWRPVVARAEHATDQLKTAAYEYKRKANLLSRT